MSPYSDLRYLSGSLAPAPTPTMVLSTIFSIHEQILNATEGNRESSKNSDVPKEKISMIPVFEMVIGTITYVIIIMITVIGNLLVVFSVFSYRPLKKVQNYFLVSLAVSDLTVALIVMPLHVIKFLANGRWLLGVTMCQIFTTADILLCTSSILNLCAIAIDRYWAIHDPINYAQKRTLKFVTIVIILVWILSAMISIPPLFGWNDYTSQQILDHCELSDEKAFVVFSASGSFFLPLIVMVVIYVKIFLAARNRIRKNQQRRSAMMRIEQPPPSKNISSCRTSKIRNMPLARKDSLKFLVERAPLIAKDGINGITSTISAGSDSKGSDDGTKTTITTTTVTAKSSKNGNNNNKFTTELIKKKEKISVAKEKRAAKTIAVIIFVFTFCWLPFFCAYVIMPFCEGCYLHPKVLQAFVWLGYINSSLNPFLYGILNMEFRKAFKRILCPKKTMGKRPRSTRKNNKN